MDNFFKLILFFSLQLFSFNLLAVTYSTNPTNIVLESTRLSNGRFIVTGRNIGGLSPSMYKMIKDFVPTRNYVFNAPVPVSSTGSVARGLAVTKPFLGALSKLKALSPAGVAFQALILASPYILESFSDSEKEQNDFIEGSYKDVTYTEFEGSDDDVNFGGCNSFISGNCEGSIDICYQNHFDYCYIAPCPNNPNPDSSCVFGSNEPTEITRSATDEELHDLLISDMTDQEFEDFMESPVLQPTVENSEPFQQLYDDIEFDFDDLTDLLSPSNEPNLATVPSRNFNEYDDALDSLTVPELDSVSLTSEDTQFLEDYLVTTFTEVETEVLPDKIITTTTITTVYTDPETNRPIKTEIDVSTETTTTPDASNPESPDPSTTTSTSSSTEFGDTTQKVEVVNFPFDLAVQEQHNLCEEHPDSLSCVPVGELPVEQSVPQYDVPFDVSIYDLASDSTCPAPIVFTLLRDFKEYSLSYQPICDLAILLKPLIVALGLYLSFLIVGNSIKAGGI